MSVRCYRMSMIVNSNSTSSWDTSYDESITSKFCMSAYAWSCFTVNHLMHWYMFDSEHSKTSTPLYINFPRNAFDCILQTMGCADDGVVLVFGTFGYERRRFRDKAKQLPAVSSPYCFAACKAVQT